MTMPRANEETAAIPRLRENMHGDDVLGIAVSRHAV